MGCEISEYYYRCLTEHNKRDFEDDSRSDLLGLDFW